MKPHPTAEDLDTLSPEELRARAVAALRKGDFRLAERVIARGGATWDEMIENLRIYQTELQLQADELIASQAQTQQALDRFARLFAGLPLPSLLIDANGVVLEANRRADEEFGIAAPMLRGSLFHRLVHADDYQAEVRGAMLDARSNSRASVEAVRFRVRGGAEMVGDLHVECLRQDETGAVQYACVIVDRTQQLADAEALQSSQARLRARDRENAFLAEQAARAPSMVIVTDPQRRIVWANAGAIAASGYSLEEMRGRTPSDLLQGKDTDPATVAFMKERLDAGLGFSGVQVLNYRKDGTPYWLEIEVLPMTDASGKVVLFIALQSDITARAESRPAG